MSIERDQSGNRFRRTSVGCFPTDWELRSIGKAGQVLGGRQRSPNRAGTSCKYLRVANVFDGYIDTSDILEMPFTQAEREHFLLHNGDVLLNEGQSLELVGRSAIYRGDPPECCFQNTLVRFRPGSDVLTEYAQVVFRNYLRTGVFASIARKTTSIAHLGASRLARLEMPLPAIDEQHAIAEALGDVDRLLAALEKLIAKKRAIRRAAMQQLLTGKTRLPGFTGEWETKQIADVATPATERNTAGDDLPVLTCSKHLGFVDSLAFFRNQIFSRDLSGYRVIRRGQIGFPANHIEEGSIGLQDLYDVAIVSPIYVVFSTDASTDSLFLHRLLKLDRYQQAFANATSSSVDRRGSLRWPEFSRIVVRLPPLAEQRTIVAILSDMDAEIKSF